MPPLLHDYNNSDINIYSEGEQEDEDSDTGLYHQQGYVPGTHSETHSNTLYHSSKEDQYNRIADQVGLGMVYNRESDATRSGNSSIVQKLHLQQKLYDTGPLEDYCSDTEKCLQRYFKTIYRQVKSFQILKKI